jgi:hypothetical protein
MAFYIWDVFWRNVLATNHHDSYSSIYAVDPFGKPIKHSFAITALTATILDIHFKSNL